MPVPTPADELARVLAEDPGVVIEDAAKKHNVTPQQIVEAMPGAMRSFAPGAAFVDAMMDISRWGDVTLIVNTDDGIIEFTGPIAEGQVSRGYYNVMARTGFHLSLIHI